MEIKERLKRLRKESGWTILEAAQKLHIAKSTYAGYEYGRRQIPNSVLPQVAALYGVSIDFLMGISDERNTSEWEPITSVASDDDQDLARYIQSLGASVIKLNAELLEKGVTREELERLLQMILTIKDKDGDKAPSEEV